MAVPRDTVDSSLASTWMQPWSKIKSNPQHDERRELDRPWGIQRRNCERHCTNDAAADHQLARLPAPRQGRDGERIGDAADREPGDHQPRNGRPRLTRSQQQQSHEGKQPEHRDPFEEHRKKAELGAWIGENRQVS
jgi:hypothetical protein